MSRVIRISEASKERLDSIRAAAGLRSMNSAVSAALDAAGEPRRIHVTPKHGIQFVRTENDKVRLLRR